MKYTKLFGQSFKEDPKEEISINAKYLQKAGYIDKLMTGSYTLLTLGKLVEKKIEEIIRKEMQRINAQEILMPLLHPKSIWNETGRWDSARDVMYQFEKDGKEYALSFTHEEIVMDLVRKHALSYKNLPILVYHFSTKFRNELRAKSGILRTREFLMKDLYSVHISQEGMMKFYEEVSETYFRIFKKLGLKVKRVEASGGVFTESRTHEFQVLSNSGEDTIYYCSRCDFAQNSEIYVGEIGDTCPKCGRGKIETSRSIEVGNIFPLGTYYSEKMGVDLLDKDGSNKPAWLASYGIGVTRCIGAIVEVHHDLKGIKWPKSIAPFDYHLIGLNLDDPDVKLVIDNFYEKQNKRKTGYFILYDDREDVSAGEKFATADLIGVQKRIVISKKTLKIVQNNLGGSSMQMLTQKDFIEMKDRDQETSKLIPLDEF